MIESRPSGRCTPHPDDDVAIPFTEHPAREAFAPRFITVPNRGQVRDWDQGGEAYVGTRRLTLAAMMKSFSCNPLIAWVRNRTVQ